MITIHSQLGNTIFFLVAVRSKEHDLIEDLFTDYNPKVRPVLDANDTVQVSLSLSLSKLNYLVSIFKCRSSLKTLKNSRENIKWHNCFNFN